VLQPMAREDGLLARKATLSPSSRKQSPGKRGGDNGARGLLVKHLIPCVVTANQMGKLQQSCSLGFLPGWGLSSNERNYRWEKIEFSLRGYFCQREVYLQKMSRRNPFKTIQVSKKREKKIWGNMD